MPGSSAKGLAHLPIDLVPEAALNVIPTADAVNPQGAPTDATGLSYLPVDLFPVSHFPDAAANYLPIADIVGL